MTNPSKAAAGRFPLAERLDLLSEMTSGLPNVTLDTYVDGMLVDYCRQADIDVVVRGVRTTGDLGYELPMAQMNRQLAGVETFLIPTAPAQAYISSSLVTATTRTAANTGSVATTGASGGS